MCEINDGPSDAGGATEDGENEDPRKEKDEDVSGPNARVREPLRVPVQIRRWHRLHVQLCHEFRRYPFNPKKPQLRDPRCEGFDLSIKCLRFEDYGASYLMGAEISKTQKQTLFSLCD